MGTTLLLHPVDSTGEVSFTIIPILRAGHDMYFPRLSNVIPMRQSRNFLVITAIVLLSVSINSHIWG